VEENGDDENVFVDILIVVGVQIVVVMDVQIEGQEGIVELKME